jgi:hypothetical protein
MEGTFELIKSVIEAGKSIIDNLFTKKLTQEDVESIIAEHHVNQPVIREKFFVVIKENQELTYNEKNGELSIKNTNVDKIQFQQLFLEKLIQQMYPPQKDIWTPAELVEPQVVPSEANIELDILERIARVKEKHRRLYGES